MFKSMKSIIFLIVVVIIIIISIFVIPMIQLDFFTTNSIYSNDVTIYQADKEHLQIVENITVDIKDSYEGNIFFPIAIYKEYKDGYVDLIDIKITLNNEEILTEYENGILIKKEQVYTKNNLNNNQMFKNINKDIVYFHSANHIGISNKNNNYLDAGKYVIKVSYKCKINDVINNYNNIAALKVRRNIKFDNLNVTITFPAVSSSFDVSSNKAVIENVSNSIYKVNLSKVEDLNKFEYVSFTFGNNMFSNANRVYENYDILKETSIFANEEEINKIYFFVISISTIILYIITIAITKKVSLEKNYVRDTNDVISPMLAESLIDRKMRFKRAYNDMYC